MGELSQIRYMGIKRYSQSRLKPSDPSLDPVWVLGCGYDIDLLVMALREQGTPIRWIQSLKGGRYLKPSINSKVRKELACQWGPLLRQEQFWAPLMQWGIGHNELFASVVRFWWDQELPEQCELYGLAETVLKKNHVKAVISWDTTSGPLASPIIQAAQKQGIPCIIYQHGSTFRIDGLWWYRWLIRADMLLVYGEGTAKHLRDTWPDSENPRARILAVGSARLDAISRSIHQNQTAALRSQLKGNDPRPLILYVPTPFGGVGRAFSDVAGYPNVSYFELQQQVLIIFSENPGVRLLYKDMITRNALYNPLSDFIQARIPNATVIRECALAKLFWAVDAIIVDHAITAMAEALLTTKPLLVYDPSGMSSIPEPPEARALLRKRAIVSGTHQDFLRDIRKFLQEGNFSDLASPNQECLAYYGTYLNDGHSADRAAREILKCSSHQTNHSCSL